MTSQTSSETNTIHMLPNIPRSKGNQTMKFSQLLEYNKRNIFIQKSWRLVPDLFLFSEKAQMR